MCVRGFCSVFRAPLLIPRFGRKTLEFFLASRHATCLCLPQQGSAIEAVASCEIPHQASEGVNMSTSVEPSGSLVFEVHATRIGDEEPYDPNSFPWDKKKWGEKSKALVIAETDGLVWARAEKRAKTLKKVDAEEDAAAGFAVARHRGKSVLAMLPRIEGVLVNGRPALPLAILSLKDCVVVGPAIHAYVTERYKPYVGHPPDKYLSKQCPVCRIPFEPATELVTCRCGAAYHYERTSSADGAQANEPLVCFEKVQYCLSCQRPLVLQEHLEWDPAKL